ncbi:MAG: DUF3159 domain-containing protein [Microbacterium sp.]|nr:DUF3159 domain-containing protein [Microbacterium sp.]MBN9190596.1 DUF3159 domain-containing protein [Microbacterium sp.]
MNPERERTPAPDAGPPDDGPRASDVLGAALGKAAQRAGLDPSKSDHTGHVVWHAMGGWRGIAESVLPSLAFLITFTATKNLVLALVVSVGLAVVFTAIRLIARQPAGAAVGGLVAAGIAAALALWTGRAEDNFLWGFLTNGGYGLVLLVSALVGWPLIGLAAGWLMNEGTGWRSDRRKRRVYFWLTIAWAALFAARLAVQLPLYFAAAAAGAGTDANVALTGALGAAKLIMGLPLFAPMVAVTWLAVRALYPKDRGTSASAGE